MDHLLGLSFLSAIVANSLTLNLVENAGILFKDGNIYVDSPSDVGASTQLHGAYADALLATSIIALCLAAIYILCMFYRIKTKRVKPKYEEGLLWIAYIMVLLACITSMALNVTLIDQYTALKDIRTDPAVTIPQENFKLRGPMGTGLLAMNSISLIGSSVAVVCLLSIYFPAMKVHVI
jgi:hypothetical protein